MSVYPNVVIAGVPKSGTTSLFRYLSDHPEVCASNVKETRFLIDKGYSLFRPSYNVFDVGIEGYSEFFRSYDPGRHRVVLEATPDYMYQETALKLLPTLPQPPTVFFILRKPSSRIYSLFRYAQNNVGKLRKTLSFKEFVLDVTDGRFPERMSVVRNAVIHSEYDRYLPRWYEAMGKERIRVFLFEEMVAKPKEVMKHMSEILRIDGSYYDGYEFRVGKRTYRVRSQRLHRIYKMFESRVYLGRFNGVIKSLYGTLNTREASPMGEEDRAVLKALDGRFADSMKSVAELTGLDLACWRSQGQGEYGKERMVR